MYEYEDTVDNLLSEISQPEVVSDLFLARKWIKKVHQLTACDYVSDSEALFPEVVKLLASSDLIIKKLCAWYILRHSSQGELLLLAVNTLLKDCSAPNPMVRGLALRTLAALAKHDLVSYVLPPIQSGMADRSAYVRRVAVVSCAKLHDACPEYVLEHGLIDQLYSLIRDSDPVVATSCLETLEYILASEGGMVVSRSMAHYLLNHLGVFSEWNLVMIFHLLKRHFPRSEEETLDVMNLVDPYLKHCNAAVFLAALNYFRHLIRDMPHLKGEVYSRAKHQVLHFIGSGGSELVYMLLDYVESIMEEHQDIFQTNFKGFFCRYNEPLYLKEKKVSLLPRLVTVDNAGDILDELGMHCRDVSVTLCQVAVKAIATIAVCHESLFEKCIHKLLGLVQLQISHLTSHIVQVFQTIDFGRHGMADQVITFLPQYVEQVTDTQGRAAILWLLGEYGALVVDAPYYLEELVNVIEEENPSALYLSLLTAAVKMFLYHPAQTQDLLGHLLEEAMGAKDRKLKDKARFYYQLLQKDPGIIQQVLCVQQTGHET